jgi:two-component system, OmpR family, phosphate regulon response regulator PhoB
MKRILIVDDDPNIRELVQMTLEADENDILEAESGEKAIEIARIEKQDLIIMDIMMPGNFDGLEATRRIKSAPETTNSRIVMLTAKTRQDDIAAGRQAGADGYPTKPFSPLALIDKTDLRLVFYRFSC